MQVLPVTGQNDGSVDALLISGAEFEGWVERHRAALAGAADAAGTPPVVLVAESNEAMRGSYAMLDAACRWVGCLGRGGAGRRVRCGIAECAEACAERRVLQ